MVDVKLEDLANKASLYAGNLGAQYCDVRAETTAKQYFVLENGQIQYTGSKNDRGLGVRVLKDGAWGFYAVSNPMISEDITNGVEQAVKCTQYYSQKKKTKIKLANTCASIDTVNYPVLIEPTVEELIKIGFECDNIIKSKKRIIKSSINMGFGKVSKYFVNSEGSKINQNYTDVIADLSATAHESGLSQTVNTTEGGRGGMETFSEGQGSIVKAAHFVSDKASQLIDAKPVKGHDQGKKEASTVIMNPDFVGLLTHEILGHPSEADRVLGKEMAWAGGAWWSGMIGTQIGSENLNVFDDPTTKGSLGWYQYDDEGLKASKTVLVENGILKNHLQSRETAEIFGVKPNANMRATSYKFMPLLRMACTCIDKGDWDPQEMIQGVKNGYFISNMKIPSIDMKRYNWTISCQFAQKIQNGQITDLLRDVIVMGTAPEFFKSIDACGKDFTVRPITNCGKGDPMQSMMMGNGGPSIRAQAIVKSVES